MTLHGTAVKATLKALLEANWKVKLAKCNFAFVALQVLGSLFQQVTRSVDPEKLVDLSKKGVPRTQKQLVSLLTFINYLRDFIPSYNRILGPLESLRPKKKISQEDWVAAKADKSLEDVLEVLNSGVVLHLPSAEAGPFFIDVDASQFGVGAVLYQRPFQCCSTDSQYRSSLYSCNLSACLPTRNHLGRVYETYLLPLGDSLGGSW